VDWLSKAEAVIWYLAFLVNKGRTTKPKNSRFSLARFLLVTDRRLVYASGTVLGWVRSGCQTLARCPKERLRPLPRHRQMICRPKIIASSTTASEAQPDCIVALPLSSIAGHRLMCKNIPLYWSNKFSRSCKIGRTQAYPSDAARPTNDCPDFNLFSFHSWSWVTLRSASSLKECTRTVPFARADATFSSIHSISAFLYKFS